MNNHIVLSLNFWEAKQLEYWLKDNYPNCSITAVNKDSYCPPEDREHYKVTGDINVDMACIIQLKYGIGQMEHGKN